MSLQYAEEFGSYPGSQSSSLNQFDAARPFGSEPSVSTDHFLRSSFSDIAAFVRISTLRYKLKIGQMTERKCVSREQSAYPEALLLVFPSLVAE